MVVKGFFSEVVETALADGPHKPSGELVRPTSNLAARSGGPAREVTRTITRAHPKGTLRTVDTTRSIFASFNQCLPEPVTALFRAK